MIISNLSKVGLSAAATRAVGTTRVREVVLPGFNLFSHDKYAKAHEWTVPSTQVGSDTILSAYEEYADRRLGRVPCPERVVRQVVAPRSVASFLGSWRPAHAWWQPAAKLMAVAYSKGAELESLDGCVIQMKFAGYEMSLDRDRMFCNTKGRFVSTSVWASDADIANISTPDLKTSHPLACALSDLDVPESTLWAANSILTLDPKFQVMSLVNRAAASRGVRARRTYSAMASPDAMTAAAFMADALSAPEMYTAMDYYRIAVPYVMSARKFTSLFGSPWRDPERRPRDTTLKKVREYLGTV